MRNRAHGLSGALPVILVVLAAGLTVAGCEKRTSGESGKQTSTNEDRQANAEPQAPGRSEQPAATDGGKRPPVEPGTQPSPGGETGEAPTGTERKPPAGEVGQLPATNEPPPSSGEPPAWSEQQTGGTPPPAETPGQTAPPAAAAGNLKYVGVAACAICHKGAAKGSIYEVWLASSHAKAFEKLGAENQKNGMCLACHTTGYGKPLAANVTPEKMVNVQCEACHGPGSEYKALAVMKSRDESMKKGLVIPTKETCLGCHGGKFPEGHPAVAAFDHASALKKIEHHSKPTEPTK